ncbi:M23 family metallopeptidase [Cellulophaga sp. 20_2_10]|uniref:M23 family metallopeptidase n=1 Tax=Cellulophaga sp. 20_2_10 TaxID=2942476 RepID=UPI00201B167A|nr:M23 family metallopeptidase [Cellulophaga sp. 20_2_10]MCL5245213.1 M23 family metallopeptidase [Cellulophaga sp. 20_2_10]
MKYILLSILCSACTFSKGQEKQEQNKQKQEQVKEQVVPVASKEQEVKNIFKSKTDYIATNFNFPVGKPNAKGYYNAQVFGKNNHLGDDWNAVTGGNSDLGQPIYSIANGYVNFAEDIGGGWGKVIRVWHLKADGEIVESLYAHCNAILNTKGEFVKIGQKIATIGNADGQYLAHLHLEIREDIKLPVGPGYSENTKGYLDPTKFIKGNR